MKSRNEFTSESDYYKYLRAFLVAQAHRSMLQKDWFTKSDGVKEHVGLMIEYADEIINRLKTS